MTEMVDISIEGLWWGHQVGVKERRWERGTIILDWRLNNPRLTYFSPRYKSCPKIIQIIRIVHFTTFSGTRR